MTTPCVPEYEFMKCKACEDNGDAFYLCNPCAHNRDTISHLYNQVLSLTTALSKFTEGDKALDDFLSLIEWRKNQ